MLGPAGDLRRQLAAQLSHLGLDVISLQQLARKDLARVSGAGIVVFFQTDVAQPPDAQQLRDYGLARAVPLTVGMPGDPSARTSDALTAPVHDTDLLDALAAAGYQVPAHEELLRLSDTLLRLVAGNTAVTAELVTSLLATGESDLADYQRECADYNWINAGSRAHRLGGTARMSGCHTLIALCARAEALCRQGDAAGIRVLNALLVPGVQRLCAMLRILADRNG